MKLPLKFGIPLLVLLLLGVGTTEGMERLLLLLGGMGVALWSAFSLPHPGPREAPREDPLHDARKEAGQGDGEGPEAMGSDAEITERENEEDMDNGSGKPTRRN